jgi:hypothetical protein
MGTLSGKISQTRFGRATNALDYTEVLVKPMEQSERRFTRKFRKGGWVKPSLPTRKPVKSSFHRSIDGI